MLLWLIGEYGSPTGPGCDEMRAAIEAALDLHPPYTDHTFGVRCNTCASREAYPNGVAVMEPWPCPTRRAIAEKLGVEVGA